MTRVLNTDDVLRPYQEAYDSMPYRYRIQSEHISLWRRLMRWLKGVGR